MVWLGLFLAFYTTQKSTKLDSVMYLLQNNYVIFSAKPEQIVFKLQFFVLGLCKYSYLIVKSGMALERLFKHNVIMFCTVLDNFLFFINV